VQGRDALLAQAASALRAPADEVVAKIAQLQDNAKALEKEIARLKGKLASGQGDEIMAAAKVVNGVKLIAMKVDADSKGLRELLDQVKNKLGSGVAALAVAEDGKVSVIAGVTADLISKVKAGDLVGHICSQIGGKGGGKPDMAQGGGTDASKLDGALASVEAWLAAKV
jgi:alanyl-tRNA synthetase